MAGHIGPILAGCEDLEIRRTSTPLVEFDPFRLTAVTASGRPYRLVGDPEPGYALIAFHSLWNASDAEVRVVSPAEAVALIAKQGNAPFEHTPAEQARLDLKKLRHLAAQTRMQITVMGIAEDEAARRAGLSVDELRGLLSADPSWVSADRADQAFVRLVGTAYRWVRDDIIIPDPDADSFPMGSSGNIFRDLGFPDADVRFVKADAAISIAALIHERGLSMAEAADLVGMAADTLFGIVTHGRVDGVSLERLDRVVEALIQDTERTVEEQEGIAQLDAGLGVDFDEVMSKADRISAEARHKATGDCEGDGDDEASAPGRRL
ncbi:XRE family transcriptional regulator [Mesorhizobium sp. ES1-4]|uniref:XRE family transcriptional regulator n=1 Tax=Mesorhizobium sp. ES1-4 TaxID=2876627 RepID=UPI001CD0287A|nr:XRE family transcriptional regulator [Mesorhizobium sp. ES1-4]MBZ9798723.1 helix-turn-helix domain-containing protein [Mesorhizobium sp. ES1-4]